MERVDDGIRIPKDIKSGLYAVLRESLTKPRGKKQHSFIQDYVEQILKDAQEDSQSAAGQWLTKQLMADGLIEKLNAETDKYLARDYDFLEFRLLKTLYQEQRDVFLDKVYRKKAIIGSRRIGKTEMAARLLLDDVIKPNRRAVYINLKFENAIRQCYEPTVDIAKMLGFAIERESKSDGELSFANGSQILFKGNNNKAEADKLLGYKYSMVIIDEVQTQVNLMYLLDTVIKPTTADYEDSQIILLGTPPRINGTAIEKIWNEYEGWKHYSWDMLRNPYIHDVKGILKSICQEKGITEDAPFIQREYFGKWVRDVEALVFKDYKTYKEIPADFIPTDIVLGVDFGFEDYNAVISLAYNRNTKQAFIIDEFKENRIQAETMIEKVRELFEDAKKFLFDRDNHCNLSNVRIVADSNEKMIVYEMYAKGLPANTCFKYDKMMALSQLAEWCRTSKILVPEPGNIFQNRTLGVLDDEFNRTIYKRDEQDNIINEIDDELFHPDAIDAFLYASRQMWYDMGEDFGGKSSEALKNEQ